MSKRFLVRSIVRASLALVCAAPALAGTLGLSWNAASGATGYRIYYGTAPGTYTGSLDVHNVTSASVTGLSDCVTWYMAVKSYNYGGESPAFSEEVSSWPRPVVTTATPGSTMQGSQVVIDVTGSNLQAGSTITIDNANVFIDSSSITSCTAAQILATVEPTSAGVRAAEVGKFTVTITNPDSVAGSKSQAFEVLVDPSRFDINQSDDVTAGRLDGMDTVWLSRLFGAHEGDSLYDPDYDFSGDGWVDGEDLAYLATNLGRCWSGSSWTAAACAN
jgi:hypothetical protein